MRKYLITLITIITLPLLAQDITNKLGADDATATYDITDSGDNLLFRVQGDNGLLVNGTFGTGTIPTTGAGTRFMWYPAKAAFRAGGVDGVQWDDSNIGIYSTAMGDRTTASEGASTAMGLGTTASGLYSTAMGYRTTGSGVSSTAMGYRTTASGLSSAVFGRNTNANSHSSFVIGRYNVGGGSSGSWIESDPLFEIGNGTSDSNKANAMTVLKNGNVGIGTIAPEATLDVHGIVKAFGDWDNSTYITETVYQAPTDGFVCAYLMNSGGVSFGQISGKTDANNPPTTYRAFNTLTFADGSGDQDYMSIMMPVKKGDYWLVTDNFSGGNTFASFVNWIPLGQ